MKAIDCRKGMEVLFGRPNGEQTRGEVVKMNPTKAKVRTLETRGRGRSSGKVGVIWNVPYSMMTPVTPGYTAVIAKPVTGKSKLDLDVTVADGKYRIIMGPDTTLQALRHGEEWRKLDGDNLVLALAQEIRALQEKIMELENTLMET